MPSVRFPTPISLVILLGLAAAVLGGLMLGVAGDRKGMQLLPSADGSKVEVLNDRGVALTFDDVRAKPDEAWQRWDGRGYIQCLSGEAVWVRVTLRNPHATPRRGVLTDTEYFADHIALWTADDTAGRWGQQRTGEWVPAAEKPLWGRDAAFFVEVPARGERVVWLRAQDHFGVWLRPVWWPEARVFLSAQLRDSIAEAAYFGMLLGLLVYNGVVWARLRFREIGWYLGYLGAGAGCVFMARAQHQLLGWSIGSPIIEPPIMLALAAGGFFHAQFARTSLELKTLAPRADRAARGMAAIMVLLGLVALITPWMTHTLWIRGAVAAVGVTHLVTLAGALLAWRAGSYYARFFVLSFGLLLAGILPAIVIWLLAIPFGMSAMSMLLGSALEMLLLSLAIADRFARLQQEKISAQAVAMEEAEKRRQIQEAYTDELEHEVRARTRELAAANADKDRMMAVLGHDLRSPLTALTLAAEQAPRETFAVAAAQTGRRLLLLLEDVVLWARLRAGSGKMADQAAANVVAPAVELYRAAAERAGVALTVAVEPELGVRTDLVPAQALVRNLVSNAVKSARSRVAVTVATNAGAVRISVRDDGPGLPPAVAARLAGGTQAGDDGQAWGMESGLGLRLCVEIARALGTRLAVTTPPDGGTEIGFTVPRAGN